MSGPERSSPGRKPTSSIETKLRVLNNDMSVKTELEAFGKESCPTKPCSDPESCTQSTKGDKGEDKYQRRSQSPPIKVRIINVSDSRENQSLDSTIGDCTHGGLLSRTDTILEHRYSEESNDVSSSNRNLCKKAVQNSSPVSSQVEPSSTSKELSSNFKSTNSSRGISLSSGRNENVSSGSKGSASPHSNSSPKSSRSVSPSYKVRNATMSSNDLLGSFKSESPKAKKDVSPSYSRSISSNSSRDGSLSPTLREFHVLDELEDDDQEEGEVTDSNSDESEFEDDIPIDDVDVMLEEGLPEKYKNSKTNTVQLRRKVVLEEIGHNHFDLLPEGWIQIMHCSGMPVFLHKKSRVCTMARPYYLGPGSSRNHKVPLSAIPCLQYRRALDTEKKNKEEEKPQNKQEPQSEIELVTAEIETFEENEANQSLESSEINEYCKNLFKFRTLNLIPFKSWTNRRKFAKMTRDIQKKERPTLPGGTKLIKCPLRCPDGTVPGSKKEWIINPNGKSYVCILHEYVQHALKKHPKYQFKELENSATPYSATVCIDNIKYGFGAGASKKQAKVEAAKVALEVLIPGMKDKIERDSQSGMRSGITKRSDDSDISIFDEIKVEDPRVAEFCAKSTEPPPYAILLTCLSRNTGVGDIKVSYEMSSSSKGFKQDEYTMVVGNHKVTIPCKNKREGKQRAAQAILQALHPNITYWGSLLRMYGNRSIKQLKEKKQEEQEITVLQSKASINQPNFAILDKLKSEIFKLKGKRESVKTKGTFILPKNIDLPSLSFADLNKVNLLKESN